MDEDKRPNAEPGGKADGQTVVGRLRRTIAAAAAGTGSRSDLEDAACALVRHLRTEHHAPEQMLLRIKSILSEAGLEPSVGGSAGVALGANALLYRDIIGWSIEHYFRDGHDCE